MIRMITANPATIKPFCTEYEELSVRKEPDSTRLWYGSRHARQGSAPSARAERKVTPRPKGTLSFARRLLQNHVPCVLTGVR
jgi:hypothetical protein